jgi:hypothetical protein
MFGFECDILVRRLLRCNGERKQECGREVRSILWKRIGVFEHDGECCRQSH